MSSLKVFSGEIINSLYTFIVLDFNSFIFSDLGSHWNEDIAFDEVFISSFNFLSFSWFNFWAISVISFEVETGKEDLFNVLIKVVILEELSLSREFISLKLNFSKSLFIKNTLWPFVVLLDEF